MSTYKCTLKHLDYGALGNCFNTKLKGFKVDTKQLMANVCPLGQRHTIIDDFEAHLDKASVQGSLVSLKLAPHRPS